MCYKSTQRSSRLGNCPAEDIYSHGNLVSLKLHNFMTFDDLDLTAGANLNFVLGPNGTGKSAIVCGLILGLGGDASHTGRPGSLGEYIQFGKQQCSVTIELFNANGANYVIERTLQHKSNSDSARETSIKSDWQLNGKKAKLQEIKDLTNSLNIFTDNLCQFLPQEKVVEFCKLNKQQLLLNTEKAVGNIQMYDDHLKLIKLSTDDRANREVITNLEKQFESYDNLNQHYEAQVSVIRERQETEKKMKLYSMKKPWLEYDNARQEHTQLRARAVEIEQRLTEKKNKLPFDRILAKKQAELKKLNDKLKDKGSTTYLTKQIDKIKQELENAKANEKDKIYEYNMQFTKLREQQENIEKMNAEIAILKNQLDSIEDEALLVERSNKLEDEIKDHMQRNTNRHDEKFAIRREKQKIDEQILQKKTLLKRETNILDQRMQVLRQADERVWEITKWLEKNQHQFQGTIHPPMMLLINAKRPEYINLIENLIPKKDMLAFICTDDRDITKFNELVNREFHYRVSVLTTPDCELSHFLQRQDARMLNYFDMFASDMFTCPVEVLAYLYSQAHLHEIPVNVPTLETPFQQAASQQTQNQRSSQRRSGAHQTTSSQGAGNKYVDLEEVERSGLNLRRCIANGNIYTIQRSEYDGESVTEIRQLLKAKLLCGVQNEDKIQALKQEITDLESQNQEKTSKLDQIESEFKKEEECMAEDKEMLDIITHKRNEKSKLNHKISMFENKLKTLKEFKIDLNKEKAKLNDSLRAISMKKLELFESSEKQLTKTYQDEMKFIYDRYNQMQLKKQVSYVENLSRQYEEQFKQLEDELAQSKELMKESKKRADFLFKEAHKATGTDEQKNLPKSLKEKFDQIPDTLEELNSEIRKLELKLVFSSGNIDGQDETQRLYQENKNQLTTTKQKLDDLKKQQDEILAQKELLKENWLREINGLIDQISEKFEFFMRKLNFDGHVKLYKDQDEIDFERYGISVFVRYRDTEECTELDYNIHSGGERSVATMIYIIALQKLTAVPFRVVDEINQGMDDTNERNVLKLIMEISKEESSQYFILSPKLVPGLTFNEKCDLQFIFNGAFNFADFKL